MTVSKTTDQVFDDKWMPEPNSGCHLWIAGLSPDGYGKFNVSGKTLRAHRYALVRKLGRPVQDGHHACHTCDVPICVNEDHLFEGTNSDNMKDMVAKGRNRGGRAIRWICVNGHDKKIVGFRLRGTKRSCRECERARAREAWRRSSGFYDRP